MTAESETVTAVNIYTGLTKDVALVCGRFKILLKLHLTPEILITQQSSSYKERLFLTSVS